MTLLILGGFVIKHELHKHIYSVMWKCQNVKWTFHLSYFEALIFHLKTQIHTKAQTESFLCTVADSHYFLFVLQHLFVWRLWFNFPQTQKSRDNYNVFNKPHEAINYAWKDAQLCKHLSKHMKSFPVYIHHAQSGLAYATFICFVVGKNRSHSGRSIHEFMLAYYLQNSYWSQKV